MKNEIRFLIGIFILIFIESFSSLDYENCQHDFSQGCPVHAGDSWNCAKILTNCSDDQFLRYHCVLNSTGQPFKVIHTCAPLIECVKGTIPIYDERKKAISCKTCPEGYYQPLKKWSDEAPECLKKHTCEEEGHKIECDAGTGSSNTQDVYCRCDARKSYILLNYENREMCVEWAHATCYFSPCPDGQERLSDYSCVPLCPQGQRQDENDMCVPIILVIQTTSSSKDSLTVSGVTTPKTTTVTTTQTPTSLPTAIDSNIPTIIASVMSGFVLLILGVLFIFAVIYRQYLYKRCLKVMNRIRKRRQSPEDAHTELELESIIQGPHADVSAGNSSSEGARPNEVTNVDVSAGNNSSEGARPNEVTNVDVSAGNNSSEGARPNEVTNVDVSAGNNSSEGARPNEVTNVDVSAGNNSSEGARPNEVTNVDVSAGNNSSEGARPNEVTNVDVSAGNNSSEGARPNEVTDRDVSAGNNSSEGARPNEVTNVDVSAGNNSSEGARPNEDPHADVPAGNSSSEGARPNKDTDVDGAAENNSSQGASTNKGKTFVFHNVVIKANKVQIGDKNLSTYNFPAERQKTSDDSSSTHSSVSSLADSPHLPSSSLGELPVSRNLSSLLNLTEDIEQDTQPNQISNGRDSSEIHADTEQTYRKVV